MNKFISDQDYIKILESALNHISESVYASNADGTVVFINKEAEIADNINKEYILGKTEEEAYGTKNHQFVITHKKPIINEKITYTTNTGDIKFVHHSVYPFMEKGEIKGSFSISKDITKVDNYISKIYQLQRELKDREQQAAKNGTTYTLDSIIGKSLPMLKAIKTAQRAAQFPTNVLISGETGTGKELFAQGIHNESTYKDEPFVGLNCAAIPENLLESTLFGSIKGAYTGALTAPGLFEQAGKGTLFLDEIDNMPKTMQAKLLRTIQEKRIRRIGGKEEIPINCRIISATNRSIDKVLKENIIRADIYYRLASVIIEIPPLRERKGDGSLLTRYFISKCKDLYGSTIKDIDLEAEEIFTQYPWPGNVRELEHLIESIVILSKENEEVITIRHLPEQMLSFINKEIKPTPQRRKEIHLNSLLDDYERSTILSVLNECHGNISATARLLNIHRNALYSKMKRLDIHYKRE